jgi:hypothetical protein
MSRMQPFQEPPMSDQVHIRDPESAELLRMFAAQTGRTMKDILRDALRTYTPRPLQEGSLCDLDHLLALDWAQLKENPETLDDLYDEDGLPK